MVPEVMPVKNPIEIESETRRMEHARDSNNGVSGADGMASEVARIHQLLKQMVADHKIALAEI